MQRRLETWGDLCQSKCCRGRFHGHTVFTQEPCDLPLEVLALLPNERERERRGLHFHLEARES